MERCWAFIALSGSKASMGLLIIPPLIPNPMSIGCIGRGAESEIPGENDGQRVGVVAYGVVARVMADEGREAGGKGSIDDCIDAVGPGMVDEDDRAIFCFMRML